MKDFRLLAWNVKTGNDEARSAIREMLEEYDPHVTALSEAYSLRLSDGHGKFCGHDVLQESTPPGRKTPWFHEPVCECGEQAGLIAPGVKVSRDRVVPMSRRWVGPVNGLTHQPRRHRRLRVTADGQTWRLSLEHWPTGGTGSKTNGAAVKETVARAKSWLLTGVRSPSVIVGDLNLGTVELAHMFPSRTVVGHGPDNVIARGCKVTREVLGNYGSDHSAVLYTLKKEKS